MCWAGVVYLTLMVWPGLLLIYMINLGEIYIADNIKEKSFGLDGQLDELLPALREACEA